MKKPKAEGMLTANTTVMICIRPRRIHTERFLPVDMLKMADWMAPKKDMMAVLEYWHGYLFPMFDCKRNQEDQDSVPITRAIEPIVHLSVFLDELSLVMALSMLACEWLLWSNKDTPLYSTNRAAPPMHTSVPITLALPLLHFKFTASNLSKKIDISYTQNIKLIAAYCITIIIAYPNGKAIINVMTGTMFTKAHAKVADVYWIPRRNRYCVSDALQVYRYTLHIWDILSKKKKKKKQSN